MTDTQGERERICGILERVAGRYPEGSEESGAVKEAAGAFLWLGMHQELKAAYEKYWSIPGVADLDERQMQHLREMGIDPDGC